MSRPMRMRPENKTAAHQNQIFFWLIPKSEKSTTQNVRESGDFFFGVGFAGGLLMMMMMLLSMLLLLF